MPGLRPILVSVIVALVATAQQLCCCVVAPEGPLSIGSAQSGSKHLCCDHSGNRHDSDHRDHHDDGGGPAHHDCDCRVARTLIPVENKARLFGDGDGEPASFGVLPIDGAWWITAMCAGCCTGSAMARAGPWPPGDHLPRGRTCTPLAQRVLLTI